MKYFTNKKFLGGVAVLAILVGVYFGFASLSNVSVDAEATTTTQTETTPTSAVPTTPVVNTEETQSENTSAPAINTEETQIDVIKNVNKTEEISE